MIYTKDFTDANYIVPIDNSVASLTLKDLENITYTIISQTYFYIKIYPLINIFAKVTCLVVVSKMFLLMETLAVPPR